MFSQLHGLETEVRSIITLYIFIYLSIFAL